MFFGRSTAKILLTLLLAAGSTATMAQSPTDKQVVSMLEARKKSAQETKWILSQLSDSQKDQMIRQQAIIDGIVQVTPDPSNLTPDERERLWNATKIIDSLIAQNGAIADDQLSCRQERKLGSQLAKRKCRTKAEMERDREDARRDLDSVQRIHNRT